MSKLLAICKSTLTLFFISSIILNPISSLACTGITLKSKDGAIVYGRTLEWGSFDLRSRILIMPRGYQYQAETPEGRNGVAWTGKYGIVGIDALEKPMYADAMNEKGLAAGLFYHPHYAEYKTYDPENASRSMAPTDVVQYILSNFSTVEQVREGLNDVEVVAVVEKALGFPAPIHLLVSDPSGEQVVIEWEKGEIQFFDAPLGVITNAPRYDWHMTNLKNYLNLSPVALPEKSVGDLDFAPLGGGSGMIGLPGDFTPPSRFVRAVAFSQTARETKNGPDTMVELFRILDNFNVPLGAAEGDGFSDTEGMTSATNWTTATDLTNKIIYYHTQHDRQIQKLELESLDFSAIKDIQIFKLDEQREQSIKNRTPAF